MQTLKHKFYKINSVDYSLLLYSKNIINKTLR